MLPELESQLAELRRRIEADPSLSGLDILSHVRPSARLTVERVDLVDLAIGASRFGGVPDIPPGFEWPRWMPNPERAHRFGGDWRPRPDIPAPLGFIAQLDLSQLPRIDEVLPERGWLYFFYDLYSQPWGFDPDDRGSCRVLYADSDRDTLTRAESPTDAHLAHTASPCRVEARAQLTLPGMLDGLEYGNPTFEKYWKLQNELIESDGEMHHRKLGHPQVVQNPMERECQLASHGINCGSPVYQADAVKALEPGIPDWRMLLQIDSDEAGPGWMWGDVGRIFFWIRQQDLQAMRFDDVWLILQCS